jgi:hypothetical protein
VKVRWRRGGTSRFGTAGGWMIEEREGRGGKKDSFYCGPTGWRRASPVRPVTAAGQAREAISVFSPPPSVEPKVLIKFNRASLSVEPTRPR